MMMKRKVKEEPLVSIITPSYNQCKFIEDTILSVKGQDYSNIEHIIVDGGSSDDTLAVLRRHEKECNLRWISELDKGQSDAVSKGFQMSRGEIIGWLNSDDVYFDKHVVSYVVEQFEKMHDVNVIYGDGVLINEGNLILKVQHALPRFSFSRLLRINVIIQPSVFFRRNVILKYPIDVDIEMAMDYDFWLKITRDGVRFKHVDRLLSAFRSHSAAKSMSRREQGRAESKRVKRQHGQNFDGRYYVLLLLDYLTLAVLKAKGVKTIIQLYSNHKKLDLAFCAAFDSLLMATLRQLLHMHL